MLTVLQKTREGCGCPKLLARQTSTLLENPSLIFRQHDTTIPGKVQDLGILRQGKWLLESRPRLRERSWIFSSETTTAFLSFSGCRDQQFLGEFINVMQGLVLFFLGNHEYFGYSYSFSLGAVWELISVIEPQFFYRILSFQIRIIICNDFVSNGRVWTVVPLRWIQACSLAPMIW